MIRAVGIPLNDVSQSGCIIKSSEKLGPEQKPGPYVCLYLVPPKSKYPLFRVHINSDRKWPTACELVYQLVQLLSSFVIMGKYRCVIGKRN